MNKAVRMLALACVLAAALPATALPAAASAAADTAARGPAEQGPVERGPAERAPHAVHGAGGVIFSRNVLELLGMDRAELRKKLADGQSLAQIAKARGVSRDALKQAITEAFRQRLEERKAKFADHLDRLIDARGDAWFHMSRGKGKDRGFFPGAGKDPAGTDAPRGGNDRTS